MAAIKIAWQDQTIGFRSTPFFRSVVLMDSGSKKLNNLTVPLLQNTVKVDEYQEMERRHAKRTIEENLASITLNTRI